MVKILRESNETKEMPLECIKGATLLSKDEVHNLLKKGERKCTYQGELHWWWLRSLGHNQGYAAFVDDEGDVSFSGETVTDDDGCVRPALIINLQLCNLHLGDIFEFGEYKFKVISKQYALCKGAIGKCAFGKDYEAKDANVYDKSDIKKFVDNWFNQCAQDIKDISQGITPDSKLWDEMDLGF